MTKRLLYALLFVGVFVGMALFNAHFGVHQLPAHSTQVGQP